MVDDHKRLGPWAAGWQTFWHNPFWILVPLVVSSMAILLPQPSADPEAADWLPRAQKATVPMGIVFIMLPFWFTKRIMRNPQGVLNIGKDPETFALQFALTFSAFPSLAGLYLWNEGGSMGLVYYNAFISIVAGVYWVWRYKHLYEEPRAKSESSAE